VGKPTAVELQTLTEAEVLLRFAAEHVKELPADFAQTFAEARAAAEQNTWTPDISKKFWDAFARLCDLIQPVNMDCILTAKEQVPAAKWWWRRGGTEQVSLAERSSSRYLFALLSLLLLMIAIQLYVWMCTSLSRRVDEIFNAASASDSRLVLVEYDKLQGTGTAGTNPSRVAADLNSFDSEVERLRYEVMLLDKITALWIFPRALDREPEPRPRPAAKATPQGEKDAKQPVEPAAGAPQQGEGESLPASQLGTVWLRGVFDDVSARLADVRIMATKVQEKASLIVGTLASFVLPLLFGTIGALAYVVRTISDQIKRSTFAQNSPIRHRMRVALGALAGVVIGLFNTGLTTQVNLSPLALAFLAGYGVEAVFSLFDALVDKFKQPPPTPIEAKK